MKNKIKGLLVLSMSFMFFLSGYSQTASNKPVDKTTGSVEKIKWLTFDQAVKLNAKKPKKIFMDVYTDWCGWCKKYDAVTFSNPIIAKYINENFYAVKFDAERKDSVVFRGKTYVNKNPYGQRATHDLAIYFLKGRLSYPTVVTLNEKMDIINVQPGFMQPKEFEVFINFFGSNTYLKDSNFENFRGTFQGKITD
jgi:thioredoxin-related protein